MASSGAIVVSSDVLLYYETFVTFGTFANNSLLFVGAVGVSDRALDRMRLIVHESETPIMLRWHEQAIHMAGALT